MVGAGVNFHAFYTSATSYCGRRTPSFPRGKSPCNYHMHYVVSKAAKLFERDGEDNKTERLLQFRAHVTSNYDLCCSEISLAWMSIY
jgi:hypothetical protein